MPLDSSSKTRLTLSSVFDEKANVILHTGPSEKFIETIPDKSISLVIASPPYNIGKEYEEQIEIKKYLAKQKKLIKQLHRILKDDGSICWQVGNFVQDNEVLPLDVLFYDLFKDLKMKLRNRIVWRFGHGLNSKKRFSGRYEMVLWFTKGDQYKFRLDAIRVPARYPNKRHSKGEKKGQLSGNPKGTNPSDVWDIIAREWNQGVWEIPNVKSNHCEKTEHPCQFPVELVERCVLALTDEHDAVYDPYSGVGSSMIASIMHKRRAIGSEREPTYVAIAQERISALLRGELRTRELGKPIFEPSMAGLVAKIPDAWKRDKSSIYYDPTHAFRDLFDTESS